LRIAIVGAGAMGCLLAGLLGRGAQEVTLIDYKPGRAARIRRQGVIIEAPGETLRVPVQATASLRGVGRPELVLICVKSYDTAAAADRARPLVAPGTLVLTLQNGLGNAEVLEETFGAQRLLVGVTGQGSTLLGAGRVRHAGFGKTYIGWATPGAGEPERLGEVCAAFQAAGLAAEAVERVERYVWHKLILNAAINPLGAILGLKNGDLLSLQPCAELMSELVREAVAVARLSGILLPADDYMAEVRSLLSQTGDNLCSMLQDVLRARRTEVAYINGAIGKAAASMGMEVAVNGLVATLVEAIEQSYPSRVKKL
jgi:2-dehydropantoate 2-reductase